MKNWKRSVFYLLCAGFVFYTIRLWTLEERQSIASPDLIAEGKLVWQKYNCQSCHQFYGLGGYLGPDLTNVLSKWKGDKRIVSAFIRSGNNRMPAYQLDNEEMEALLLFLEAMDATGNSDPRHFKMRKDGMIE